MKIKSLLFVLCFGISAVVLNGCAPKEPQNRVVLYCSVDEVFAKPLVAKLEKETGLQIDAIYDTEASKTAGLANKIRSEKARPRADVFWSSALLQTLLLSDEGLLEGYQSPKAADLPAQFRGKDWAGVGVRGRVLIMQIPPTVGQFMPDSLATSLPKMLMEDYSAAFSNPQFGTASDHSTAWATRHGEQWALNWFKDFKKAKKRDILPGNGDVARGVDQLNYDFGWTDTDDYLYMGHGDSMLAITSKENILVPGAASILKNAPHQNNAKKLLDAIVSKENEAALIKKMPGVFSLRRLKEKSNWQSGDSNFSFLMNAPRDDYSKWPATWRRIREPLNEILTKN